MTTITDLITRFRIQIRDNGTTTALNDPEATQFIQDGLRTYSLYRPRRRSLTISVVAGQSVYSLPQDWIDREYQSFEEAVNPPSNGNPYSQPFEFIAVQQITAGPMARGTPPQYNFYPSDLQMTIVPTPQSDYALTFDYFACHTADDTTCTVPFADLDNALLPGAEKALESIATDYSVKLQKYKLGNMIEVDDSKISAQLQQRAQALRDRFERDIIKRPLGSMG